MKKYETIIVINLSDGEEKVNETISKFEKLINENGSISSIDKWGKRKLAYEIEKNTEAYYVLIDFSAPETFIKELNRVYGITDNILRTIVVKKES